MKRNNLIFYIIVFIVLFFITINISAQTWWHTYRINNVPTQMGWDLCQSTDGNFFIVGYMSDHSPYWDTGIIKINKFGNVLWARKYKDTTNSDYMAYACESTNDNGCIFSGYRGDSKPYATKIDSNGDIVWNKTYEEHDIYNRTVQINKTSDNGYLLCGLDYILKIDSTGKYLWSKSDVVLGYAGNIFSAIEALSSGYICVGENIPGTAYSKITKLDLDGNITWQKDYFFNSCYPTLINKLSKGYLITGFARDSVSSTKEGLFFAKIDSNGNLFNKRVFFDSLNSKVWWGRGANILNDNSYIFASMDYTNNPYDSISYTVFHIVDSLGNIKYRNVIINNHWGSHEVTSILPTNDGNIMYAGYSYLSRYSIDRAVFFARSDTTLFIDPVFVNNNISNVPADYILYQNYPNPFNPTTKIKFCVSENGKRKMENGIVALMVYDILGKEIATLVNEKLQPGTYEIKFDGGNLPSGMYFYKLSTNDFSETKKLTLIK